MIRATKELAEVRWLSLLEADELMPGMFGPVREHLAQMALLRMWVALIQRVVADLRS
jgi:hypothetical protein